MRHRRADQPRSSRSIGGRSAPARPGQVTRESLACTSTPSAAACRALSRLADPRLLSDGDAASRPRRRAAGRPTTTMTTPETTDRLALPMAVAPAGDGARHDLVGGAHRAAVAELQLPMARRLLRPQLRLLLAVPRAVVQRCGDHRLPSDPRRAGGRLDRAPRGPRRPRRAHRRARGTLGRRGGLPRGAVGIAPSTVRAAPSVAGCGASWRSCDGARRPVGSRPVRRRAHPPRAHPDLHRVAREAAAHRPRARRGDVAGRAQDLRDHHPRDRRGRHRERPRSCASEFGDAFAEFIHILDPLEPGIVVGKSSAMAWGGRYLYRLLVRERGMDPHRIIVTDLDADYRVHPQYFATSPGCT